MAAYGQTQYSPALQAAGPYTPYTHHTQGYSMPSYSEYSHFLNHLQKQKKNKKYWRHILLLIVAQVISPKCSVLFIIMKATRHNERTAHWTTSVLNWKWTPSRCTTMTLQNTKGDARGKRGGDVLHTGNKLVALQRWFWIARHAE